MDAEDLQKLNIRRHEAMKELKDEDTQTRETRAGRKDPLAVALQIRRFRTILQRPRCLQQAFPSLEGPHFRGQIISRLLDGASGCGKGRIARLGSQVAYPVRGRRNTMLRPDVQASCKGEEVLQD